jgi:hypothetical protein
MLLRLLLWFYVAHALTGSLYAQELSGEEFFERSVRPLLAEHCWQCHGAQKQWNNLRLDSAEALRAGGESGPVVVPGNPAESLLLGAVEPGGDPQMPPDKPLTGEQVAVLRTWIEMGAPWYGAPASESSSTNHAWKTHWAFQPLRRVALPPSADDNWSRNEIDRFVFKRLKENGLEPSAEADRASLIRRLAYSLTGLPPSFEQVQAFVHDPRPDAYERLVDLWLESPSYGEHLARMWLDVARYSDTKGYVYAREERFFVNAALYRDWVIQAFNSNLPYDQFLKLQIAADQCAPDDPRSLAAMGLLTLGRRFLGVTHDIIDDRIDVVGRATMGLTIACARCHDHKYDPIPTTDYYALYGVFQCSTDRQVDLTRFSSAQTSPEFVAELEKRQRTLEETTAAKRQEAADRVRQRVADYLFAQSELSKYGEEGFDIIIAATDIVPAFVRRWEGYLSRCQPDDPVFAPWFRFLAINTQDFASHSPLVAEQCRDSATVHPWVAALLESAPTDLRQLADRYGQLFKEVEQRWKELKDKDSGQLTQQEAEWLASAQPLLQVLYGATAPCEVPNEEIIATETFFDSDSCTALWKLQGEVDRWQLKSENAPQVAVGLFDRDVLVEPRVFVRGNPANKGPRISRHFLSLFSASAPQPFEHGSGRLELAERIVDPANPLTPRVWVNRLWQHHFGQGLVPTSSDFGLRAIPPSHPELLDWLASELIRSNWNTKVIQRKMLVSATFRQASGRSVHLQQALAQQIDPTDRLLWQMSSRRLSFEQARDALLEASGDLQQRIGGKPVEMLSTQAEHWRRSVYGLVDRQFLPTTLRMFDFANPDLHIGRRSETFVPQQSLYFLNHPFVAQRAQALADKLIQASDTAPIDQLYQAILQRAPTQNETEAAEIFLNHPEATQEVAVPATAQDWSYGYGEIDDSTGKLKSFQALPHYSGSAWQGGPAWPDKKIGWAQLTSSGGHPGDDLAHACVRRWTAPATMRVAITSKAKHEPNVSDGVRFRIVSSRHGLLGSLSLKAAEAPLNVEQVELQAGDTLDFVVDIVKELNSDQFLWAPEIKQLEPASADSTSWQATQDFSGPSTRKLTKLEQLAQVLMLTNEFWFVD